MNASLSAPFGSGLKLSVPACSVRSAPLTRHAQTSILPVTGQPVKPVEWVGTALDDLRSCPEDVRDVVGYALFLAQQGAQHPRAKRLHGDLAGLMEIVDDFEGSTYRAVYTVRLTGAVYVLNVFKKKATRGSATPRWEIALIKQRLRLARTHHATHYAMKEEG